MSDRQKKLERAVALILSYIDDSAVDRWIRSAIAVYAKAATDAKADQLIESIDNVIENNNYGTEAVHALRDFQAHIEDQKEAPW